MLQEVGLIRRPASFVTSMTDERGDELMYSGVKISEVVESGKGIGGVMALLWFQVWCINSYAVKLQKWIDSILRLHINS